MNSTVSKSILIRAGRDQVWRVLTRPDLVQQWLFDGKIAVSTDWQVGSPISHQGMFHGIPYLDKGVILENDPECVLRYSQWSILTEVPDRPENYTIIEFRLSTQNDATQLSLSHSNMMTEVQFKHTDFYWNVTLYKIKVLVEQP